MEISQISAYSIEDSSQWKGITSIANIPTLNKRNLVPSNLGKIEISQIFAPNLRERNEIYPIEDSSQ